MKHKSLLEQLINKKYKRLLEQKELAGQANSKSQEAGVTSTEFNVDSLNSAPPQAAPQRPPVNPASPTIQQPAPKPVQQPSQYFR